MRFITPNDTTSDDVLRILGKPSDIRTEYDPGSDTDPKTEVWYYGTAGHLSFPTLGAVEIHDGKVTETDGGQGTPPDPSMFKEAELRKLLRLIDSPSSTAPQYRFLDKANAPLQYIRCVNTLLPLGKEKTIAAIREYLRVQPADSYSDDLHIVLLLRLLFDIPPGRERMPRVTSSLRELADRQLLDYFPVLLMGDIPINLIDGLALDGPAEPADTYVDYFDKNGVLRRFPLVPTDDPLGVLAQFRHSQQWIYRGSQDDCIYDRYLYFLSDQLLNLVDTVYHATPEERGDTPPCAPFDWNRWNGIVKKVDALNIRWDAAKGIYVRGDGTYFPVVAAPIYKRKFWNCPRPGYDVLLTFERLDGDSISVAIDFTEHPQAGVPKRKVTFFRPGAKNVVLADFDFDADPPAGDEGGSIFTSGSIFDFHSGEGCQATITVGNDSITSPVMTP